MRLLQHSQALLQPSGSCPLGGMAIDWSHPITRNLAYYRLLSDSFMPPLYNSRLTDGITTPYSTPTFNSGPGGPGLTAGAIGPAAGATANNFQMSTTQGTVVVHVTAGWSPTDGLGHGAFYIGPFGSTSQNMFTIFKYLDNNWYCGFMNAGTDYRVTGAASGTFNAGDTFVIVLTYNSSGVSKLYTKGILRYQNATSPVIPIEAGTGITFGATDITTIGANLWCTSGKDAIYSMGIWDREMSYDEVTHISNNPYCFFNSAEGEMSALYVAAAGFTPIFRRTASPLGTRIGSRQTWAA